MTQENPPPATPPSPAPPPLPVQPIPYHTPGPARPQEHSGLEQYQKVAETVGMMPSLRWKDNVIQAIVVFLGTALGAAAGFLFGDVQATVIGALAGLVISALISGFVLMILGFIRARR